MPVRVHQDIVFPLALIRSRANKYPESSDVRLNVDFSLSHRRDKSQMLVGVSGFSVHCELLSRDLWQQHRHGLN